MPTQLSIIQVAGQSNLEAALKYSVLRQGLAGSESVCSINEYYTEFIMQAGAPTTLTI